MSENQTRLDEHGDIVDGSEWYYERCYDVTSYEPQRTADSGGEAYLGCVRCDECGTIVPESQAYCCGVWTRCKGCFRPKA